VRGEGTRILEPPDCQSEMTERCAYLRFCSSGVSETGKVRCYCIIPGQSLGWGFRHPRVNAVFNPGATVVDGRTLLLLRVEHRTGLSALVAATSEDELTG